MRFNGSREDFIQLLDQEHKWPTWYLFKFIVPSGKEDSLIALFPQGKATIKPSSKGNYLSVTAKIIMASAHEVLGIYEKASHIDGVLAL